MAAVWVAPAPVSGVAAAMLVACSLVGELLVHTHTALLLRHLHHTPHFSSIATRGHLKSWHVKAMSFLVHVPLSILLLCRTKLMFGSLYHDMVITVACGFSYYLLVLIGVGCGYGLSMAQLRVYGVMWVVATGVARAVMDQQQ